MGFPIKICVGCGHESELRPGKPGFANRGPAGSEPEAEADTGRSAADVLDRKSESELNEARRKTMREMLYRKEQ